MSKYLLGVDFGGGASKATLLRGDGQVLASSTREYRTYFPHNGWTEQDPEELFAAFADNISEILKSDVSSDEIAVLAISAASQSAVYLDENDDPVRKSIYWTDGRSTGYAQELKQLRGDWIYSVCHNTPTSARTICHLKWIKENEPENFNRIKKVMFVKDYIRYRLTGDFVTDYIDAMGSLLMDVANQRWDPWLCSYAGIEPSRLPEIKNPTDFVGEIRPEVAKRLGLSTKTRVIVGSTDTVMEVYANGAIRTGQMTVKLATAGRICPITDRNIHNPLLVNYKHVIPKLWYPGTGTKSCAASYRWYRDVLCESEKASVAKCGGSAYKIMDQEAAKVIACEDGLFFHPYLQGELTPYFDPKLRGSFTGLASYHTKAHFNRAVLEGVAFSLKDCYTVLEKENLKPDQAIIIGGGADSPLWSQMVCDMLGVEMLKVKSADSSLGSAMLAGVSAGIFSSFEDSVEKCVHIQRRIQPVASMNRIYERGFEKYKRIHDAMADVYAEWKS